MGMEAEVLAIGKFRQSLVKYLEYNDYIYRDTPEEAIIMTRVISCTTTYSSVELATQLGINPWKFEEHKFDPWKVDIQCLKDMESRLEEGEIDAFEALREANFEFYYMPNG